MHMYPPQSMCVEVELKLISNSIHLNKFGSACLVPGHSDGSSVRMPAPERLLHVGTHAAMCLMLALCIVPTPWLAPLHIPRVVPCPAPAPWRPSAPDHSHAGELSSCSSWLLQIGLTTTCAIPYLLLQHIDETLETYV
jgi:hypothetical protein